MRLSVIFGASLAKRGSESFEGVEWNLKNAYSIWLKEFTGWMKENAGRLQKMQAKGNLPYFVRNNMPNGSAGGGANIQKLSPQALIEAQGEQRNITELRSK